MYERRDLIKLHAARKQKEMYSPLASPCSPGPTVDRDKDQRHADAPVRHLMGGSFFGNSMNRKGGSTSLPTASPASPSMESLQECTRVASIDPALMFAKAKPIEILAQ